MTSPSSKPPEYVHPWLSEVADRPLAAVSDLLSGYAPIAPFDRAETRDAAQMLFAGLASNDPAVTSLDDGLLEWLNRTRAVEIAANRALQIAFEASDALAIVAGLQLPKAAHALREDVEDWLSWTEGLASQQKYDVRAELLSTLALTQRVIAASLNSTRQYELMPLWLTICEGAGTLYPRTYLALGLLGLRQLPERPGVANERAWMSGLARWAANLRPSVEEFSREWRSLKAVYPRMRTHWRNLLRYTLLERDLGRLDADIEKFWSHDVGLDDNNIIDVPADPVWREICSADALQELVKRTSEPLKQIGATIRREVANRLRFAQATGSSYFLTTSCCNIGMRLLENSNAKEAVARGKLASELARITLSWSPDDVYGWALWRDALEVQGAIEAAELVGWETIRRYPENSQWRTQLAQLIIHAGRLADAESLLRSTLERFPKDEVSYSMLAEMLLAQGKVEEATNLLNYAMNEGIASTAIYTARARIYFASGNPTAAKEVLASARRKFPGDHTIDLFRDVLENGGPVSLISAAYLQRKAIVDGVEGPRELRLLSKATTRGGRLRKLASEFTQHRDPEWAAIALNEVRSILADAPNHQYARYIEGELVGSGDKSQHRPFALSFIDAVKNKDQQKLIAISHQFPGHVELLSVAKIIVSQDIDAATRVLDWLRSETSRETREVAAMRGFLHIRAAESTET